SPEAIESFPLIKRSPTQLEALAHGYGHENWRWQAVVVNILDEDRQLVELRYHFTGTMPKEEVQLRGKRIEPFAAKVRDFTYLRKTLVKERIIWVPANGTLEVQLDGKPAPLTFEWPKPQEFSIRPAAVKARRGAKTRKAMKVKRRRSRARIITATDSDRFISLLARSKP